MKRKIKRVNTPPPITTEEYIELLRKEWNIREKQKRGKK